MEFISDASGRLDSLIASQDSGLSRSKIQKSIKEGSVSVNGKTIKKSSQKIEMGDSVSLDDSKSRITNHKLSLQILTLRSFLRMTR
jgi:RNA-binding protein YlmH